MPWEKQFDVDAALERAKETFWIQGYEATSMDVLLKRMGINRGSFYATFKGKRQVMLEALKRYDAENRATNLRRIVAGKNPKKALSDLFRSFIDGSRGPCGEHGCFIVNAALELAPHDPEVARIVCEAFADIERIFRQLLEEGRRLGEFGPDLDPADCAKSLLSQFLGLMVLVRASAPRETLEGIVVHLEQRLT